MGSKGRLPPHPYRRPPPPGPGIGHHDSIPPEMHPQHSGFPPFDMMPHPEVMEQKLAAQHVEIQKLATENQRFAATHGTLRQDLAAIQHELQMLHNHVGAVKSEREQQIMGMLDNIGKMESGLQGAEPLKMELNKARAEAQSLVAAREELVSRVHKLTEDHQRVHVEVQQVPVLLSELDKLRQEYQHCRGTYEYEKKLYNDHLESLQVMEKNYMTMASEVEKLRAELKKHAEMDRRTAAGAYAGYNEKDASGHYPVGQSTYDDAYGAPQARGSHPVAGGATAVDGNTSAGVRAGYDAYRGPAGPGYDGQRGPGPAVPGYKGPAAYDPQRGTTYNAQSGAAYDPQRGPSASAYDPHRGPAGPGYDACRGTGYNVQRGPGYGYGGTSFESPKGGQGMKQGSNASFAATSHSGGFQGAQQPPPAPSAVPRR